MKKLILIISALCFTVVSLKAQTKKIVRSDYAYPGGSFAMAADTAFELPTNFDQGGQNKTWDFSQLRSHETFVTKYSAPSAANGGDTVAGCNLVMQEDENDPWYTYMSISDTDLFYLGAADSEFGAMDMKMLEFPAEFGKSWSNNSQIVQTFTGDEYGLPVDSIRFTVDLQILNIVDADGVLKLPVGEANVIRTKMTGSAIITTEVYNPITGWMEVDEQEQEFISYQFFSPAGGNVIATVEPAEGEPTTYVTFRSLSLTSNKKLLASASQTQVYPNPTTDGIVNIIGKERVKITIVDATGRVVKTISSMGGDEIRADISEFPKGIYLFRLEDEGGEVEIKKIIRN